MSVNAYAATILALNDAKLDISTENITKMMKKAKCACEKDTADLFVECLKYINLEDLIQKFSTVGAGSAAPAQAAATTATAAKTEAAPKAAEKSESEESEEEMGFGLFD